MPKRVETEEPSSRTRRKTQKLEESSEESTGDTSTLRKSSRKRIQTNYNEDNPFQFQSPPVTEDANNKKRTPGRPKKSIDSSLPSMNEGKKRTPGRPPKVEHVSPEREGRQRRTSGRVAASKALEKTPVKLEPLSKRTPAKSVESTPTRILPKRTASIKVAEKPEIQTPSKRASTRVIQKKADESLKSPFKSPFKSPRKTGGGWWFNSLGVPKCPLPCRESQFEEIWKFLHENVSEKSSRCLYVSGVPGTGKTVIVDSVVDTLNRYANERKKHLQFNYVYINGLSLGSPDKIWKRFYCGLTDQKIKLTAQAALKKLVSYFETRGNLPTVLVIDELDQILDKKQSILYHLLEWSSDPSTMFSLVAIFNTMSLPENGLVMRNVSRIGLIRCIFPPYDFNQLQTIIKASLEECKSEKIKDDAIVLLSKKVAAVSGDARRALEIAKRAVEIVESGQATGVKAVDGAFKEIFSSVKIDTMKDCTPLEQMFLKTVSSELQRTGSEETSLMNVFNNLCTDAVYNGMNWTKDQFVNAATRLSMMKLIITENETPSLHKRISLNVPVEDINFALGLQIADASSAN